MTRTTDPQPAVGPCAAWDPEDAAVIRRVLDRIGDKWTVLVVGTLEHGPLRYGELHAAVPGISQRMLTLTLQQLTKDGILTRTAYPEIPPRVEYDLTPLGRSLLGAVLSLAHWAADHHEEIRQNASMQEENPRTGAS